MPRLIALLLTLTLVPTPALAEKAKKTTSDEAALYAAGAALAQRLESLQLTPAEQRACIAGFSDSARGKELKHNLELGLVFYDQFREERTASIRKEQSASYADYFDEQEAVPGTERLDSGMLVRTTTAGDGASPGAGDRVSIHYAGSLRDGRVFDSSYLRGKPTTFSLSSLIPCWQEGLQHMAVGGAATLFCPPHLAYGAEGSPPFIPPNAVLQFEVRLVGVEPTP